MAHDLMVAFGAKPDMYNIRINSRQLVNAVMQDYLGLDQVQSATLSRLIDRMHKMEHATFVAEVDALFTPSQREAGKSDHLLDLLKIKSINGLPAQLKDHESVKELSQLFDSLKNLGIANATFDISLMRGFDYYTGIVFEVFDTDPQNNRSLFGGGRYDNLLELFGHDSVPAVGFGMGDVTIRDFLEVRGLLPAYTPPARVAIVTAADSTIPYALTLAKDLRSQGVACTVNLSDKKLADQLKNAGKQNIPYALFVGDKEIASGSFVVRDLASGSEKELSREQLHSFFLNLG